MQLKIKRDTGMYAWGSPLEIFVNNQRIGGISEDKETSIDVNQGDEIRAKLVSMKTENAYTVTHDGARIVIKPKSNRGLQTGLFVFFKFFFPGKLLIEETAE
jgi:hypothetical protein